ncbi:MAG: RidA family protein [Oscillospiraceae bacterium]|jgi:2-iminobutanoate/2-iminopropanoate deaminase|nr:RidA family protein [Oscillospiraceae bacterium]
MKVIETKDAPAAIGPYSQAAATGGLVYTSGQIPVDPTTGEVAGATIAEQTDTVLKNLSAVLTAAGAALSSVVKTTCFIRDMAEFASFNEVYARYFTGDAKPARSCVEVSALPKGVLVEIEAVAEVL